MPNIPEGLPRKNDVVQSLLFAKKYYTPKQARELVNLLGYYVYDIRETKNYYRFRQFNPSDYDDYYTELSSELPGVMFIVRNTR